MKVEDRGKKKSRIILINVLRIKKKQRAQAHMLILPAIYHGS